MVALTMSRFFFLESLAFSLSPGGRLTLAAHGGRTWMDMAEDPALDEGGPAMRAVPVWQATSGPIFEASGLNIKAVEAIQPSSRRFS